MKNKILVMTLLLVFILSLGMFTSCGDDKMEQATITSVWRDDEFSRAIPIPEMGKLFSITDYIKHDRVQYVVTDVDDADFEAYRAEMLAFGYTEDKVEIDEENSSYSIRYKRDGWVVTLFYGGVNFTLKVYKQ